MEEIKIFNSPQFGEIRTTGTSENPLFCLSDVCSVLGLRQGDVKQRLDKDVVSTQPLETTGGIQQANFVNEDGLYDVILDSRKPQAKAFRKWVTSEVLPAIRKTGGYIAINHDETPEEIMARALTIAQATLAKRDERLKQLEEKTEYQQKQIEQKDARISVLQPKAFFADCIMQSEDCISIGEMANILKQNGLFGKGQNSFFEWLRWSGYLLNRGSRYNLPSQRSMRLGIMRIAEQQRGSVFINRKAVITPYGQRYFIELFGKSSTAGQCTINFINK
ncbi:phage antirepressor Ant [Phocaeicola sartorii]|uniref:Phage antirepressor Ant n=1 Tax=Phocaeicola sartorii TaxID=671267 RepID=A0A4S2FP95_9BACT|nr:phage antirepressor KilAC domain-containing protein [Phocaeicola sartorii]TGY70903.1 phage antirepressor Ant [Phocaeicola sartorii]